MRNPLKSGILAAALALACAPGLAKAATCGDAAGGGSRNVGDVAAVLTCVVNSSACASLCGGAGALDCADMNQDGVVNIADAVILLNDVLSKFNILPLCTSAGPTVPCGTVISSDITSNEVLAACEYSLDGTVFVEPGVVLTVQAGATIKGRKVSSDSTPSALVFLKGLNCDGVESTFTARINANGTPAKPIVMTSDQPVGSRQSGDWGGILFNGCSRVNFPTGIGESEGLTGVEFGHGPGGGLTPLLDDSSGIARYMRVEFAGRELAPDNELNVWTQNALGSNSQFDHLQAHAGLDDGFEWFGGTIHERYMVATANHDDNFDWQIGSDTRLQYGYAQQYAPNLDNAGSNGFEGDNNEFTAFDITPYSTPHFCNMTIIGALGQTGADITTGYAGALLRRGTAGKIAKAIITNMIETGIQVRDPETAANACSGTCLVGGVARTDGVTTCDAPPFSLNAGKGADELMIQNSIITHNGVGNCSVTTSTKCQVNGDCPGGETCLNVGTTNCKNKSGGNNTQAGCNSCEFLNLLTASKGVSTTTDPGLTLTWPNTDPRPTNVAGVTDALDCNTAFGTGDTFFDSTGYVGAFDPNGANWMDTPGGWISFTTN